MTALSADLRSTRKSPMAASSNRLIVNAETMYKDALTSIGTPTHGTSASRGLVEAWAGGEGQFLAGRWGQGLKLGDTGAAALVNGQVDIEDQVLESVLVAGLASSSFQADVLKYVYTGDDNLSDVSSSLTLTRPAAPNRDPVGIVFRGISETRADVLIFGMRTKLLMGLRGTCVRRICLGSISLETPSAQNLLTGIVMSGHGKIIDTYAVCVAASTDADATQLVNLEIDAVDVTGGVITTATADAQGDKKAGTAITAANEFHDGDLLDVEAATVTAGTANNGLYNLYITVEYLPGL